MRRVVIVGTLFYSALLGLLAVMVWQATPASPEQGIRGVGLGAYGETGGVSYLSGRRLDCTPLQDEVSPFTVACRVEIAGKPLEIQAHNNPPGHPDQLGGRCQAFYAGKTWECTLGLRHVHVQGFAYIDEPLGLDPLQLQALRNRYPIENLSEDLLFQGMMVLSLLTALVVASAATVLLSARIRSLFGRMAAAGTLASAMGCAIYVVGIVFTSGLWD